MKTPHMIGFAIGVAFATAALPSMAQDPPPNPPRVFPAGYATYDALTSYLERLAATWPNTLRVTSLGKTVQGRDLWIARLGRNETPPASPRPAIVIVANLEADHVIGSQVALRMIYRLAEADGRDPAVTGLLDRTTLYLIPRLNPDGAERVLNGAPRTDHRLNMRLIDRDRDGRNGEDGPDDLDGDGLSLLMRVRDEKAGFLADEQDPRILRKPDSAKSERPVYSVYREGVDNDGDGLIDEDAAGGVNLNRNWPHRWSEFDPEAGDSPGAEPETRALIRFLVDRPEIASVWTFSLNDNLSVEPKKPESTLDEADLPYFAELSRRYQAYMKRASESPGRLLGEFEGAGMAAPVPMTLPRVVVPTRPGSASTALPNTDATTDGSLNEWAYHQRGLPSFATRLWSKPELPEPPEGANKPPADGEPRWLYWNDIVMAGQAFVPFRAVEHPTLGTVEVGGWKPGVKLNPPDERIEPLTDAQLDFLRDLAERLPRLELTRADVRPLGGGAYEVETLVSNTGTLPTALAQGVKTRESPMVVVTLNAPGARLLAGKPLIKLETVQATQPSLVRWTILAPVELRALEIEARCPRAGHVRRSIPIP